MSTHLRCTTDNFDLPQVALADILLVRVLPPLAFAVVGYPLMGLNSEPDNPGCLLWFAGILVSTFSLILLLFPRGGSRFFVGRKIESSPAPACFLLDLLAKEDTLTASVCVREPGSSPPNMCSRFRGLFLLHLPDGLTPKRGPHVYTRVSAGRNDFFCMGCALQRRAL